MSVPSPGKGLSYASFHDPVSDADSPLSRSPRLGCSPLLYNLTNAHPSLPPFCFINRVLSFFLPSLKVREIPCSLSLLRFHQLITVPPPSFSVSPQMTRKISPQSRTYLIRPLQGNRWIHKESTSQFVPTGPRPSSFVPRALGSFPMNNKIAFHPQEGRLDLLRPLFPADGCLIPPCTPFNS